MFDLNDKIGTWTTVELIKALEKCYKSDDLNKEKNKLMIDLYNETIETSPKYEFKE